MDGLGKSVLRVAGCELLTVQSLYWLSYMNCCSEWTSVQGPAIQGFTWDSSVPPGKKNPAVTISDNDCFLPNPIPTRYFNCLFHDAYIHWCYTMSVTDMNDTQYYCKPWHSATLRTTNPNRTVAFHWNTHYTDRRLNHRLSKPSATTYPATERYTVPATHTH